MALYKRTLFTIGITVVLLFTAGFTVVEIVFKKSLDRTLHKMLAGFDLVEKDAGDRNMRRVQDAYEELLLSMESKNLDWARWDDAWVFAGNKNQAFINSNMISATVGAMGYDYLIIFDNAGKVLSCASFDEKTGKSRNLSQELLANFTASSPIFTIKDSSSVSSGMIFLPEGPLLFSIRPITHSNGSGPIHGRVMFSQYLDSTLVTKLSMLTHLNLELDPLPKGHELDAVANTGLTALNQDTLLGKLLVRDYNEFPRYMFTISIPRDIRALALRMTDDIYHVARNTDILLLLCFAMGGIAVATMLTVMLTIFIVRPIRLLASQVSTIKKSSDLTVRVNSIGKDEIGKLAVAFNGMLASLEHSQQAVRRQNLERQSILDALPIGLLMLNSDWRITGTPSQTALHWFGSDCIGKSWQSMFGLTSQESITLNEFLEALTQDLMSNKDMQGLNPFPELELQTGMHNWVRIRYFHLPHETPARMDDGIILALLEDITENRMQNDELLALRSENVWFKTVLADPDLFLEFFRESHQGLAAVEVALSSSTSRPSIARAFRHVHTLQGSSSGFGITNLAKEAVDLERQLTILLHHVDQGLSGIQTEVEHNARQSLIRLSQVLSEEEQRLLSSLKQQASDWRTGPSLRIPLHRLREWSALLGSGMGTEVSTAIEDALRMPLARLLHRTLLWFPGMVIRSGKLAELELDGGDVKLPLDWSGMLNDILVHLLRNCVAHGIEAPEERLLLGKKKAGSIHIRGSADHAELSIEIIDDGAGFGIDVNSAFGLGTSILKEYDGLAGRGVGLTAVKAMVEELGGSIQITSRHGVGTTVTLHFHLDPTHVG